MDNKNKATLMTGTAAINSRKKLVAHYLLTIFQSLPGRAYIKDKNGFYLLCNEELAKDCKFSSSDEIIGKTDYDLPSKEQAEVLRKIDRQVMESEEPLILEEPGTHTDGSPAVYRTRKIPLKDENNNIQGIFGLSVDITNEKQAEMAKSALISNMGHDLKTPFIGIEGNAKILCDQYAEEDPFLKELWDHMFVSIIEIKNIISQIIETVAMEHPSIKYETISINQELEDVKALLLATAHTKKIDLIIKKLDSNESDIIETDKLKFKLILNYFASNAIKFTDKGKITLTVLKKGDYFHIKVIDTGIGIPHDQLSNIFKPFTKLSLSNKHNIFQGVGGGLYSAEIKAEELGAVIEVKSKPGKGSTFTLIIPVQNLKNK